MIADFSMISISPNQFHIGNEYTRPSSPFWEYYSIIIFILNQYTHIMRLLSKKVVPEELGSIVEYLSKKKFSFKTGE